MKAAHNKNANNMLFELFLLTIKRKGEAPTSSVKSTFFHSFS